jgi:probable HAF family extracellular repeat protein
VGRYTTAGVVSAFLVERGTFTSIHYPGSANSLATGISPGGEIVGGYQDAQGGDHGFLFYQGSFTSIDFPAALATRAFGVNPAGDIVGDYLASDFTVHGFLLTGE